MARAKPTEETIQKMMSAVLEEARTNKKLPELLAAVLTKMREADPDVAIRILDALIEDTAASMPEDRREKFLEELLTLVKPS